MKRLKSLLCAVIIASTVTSGCGMKKEKQPEMDTTNNEVGNVEVTPTEEKVSKESASVEDEEEKEAEERERERSKNSAGNC